MKHELRGSREEAKSGANGKFSRKYAVSSSKNGSRRAGEKVDPFAIYFGERFNSIY